MNMILYCKFFLPCFFQLLLYTDLQTDGGEGGEDLRFRGESVSAEEGG